MKSALYLGTDPKEFEYDGEIIHYPLIKPIIRDLNDIHTRFVFGELLDYTDLVFTSKNTVHFFFQALAYYQIDSALLKNKQLYAIGPVTEKALASYGFSCMPLPKQETQEGLIKQLFMQDHAESYFFYPRSALARRHLEQFLMRMCVRHQICDLYDLTFKNDKPLPELDAFDEIIFTSPSTVHAFYNLFENIPKKVKLRSIGPITAKILQQKACK